MTNTLTHALRSRKLQLAVATTILILSLVTFFCAFAQDKSSFPDGFDAVQAAPATHKVIFENSLVRILEVTVPPPGTSVPMHHHHWPSFFLSWDTGGTTPHIRYHRPDGSVREQPAKNNPTHPGSWSVGWMNPEAMHEIEVVQDPGGAPPAPGPNQPSDLRIEIKCHP